jgi:TLD
MTSKVALPIAPSPEPFASSGLASKDDMIRRQTDDPRKPAPDQGLKRLASFTAPEAFVLKALLVDDDHSNDGTQETRKMLNTPLTRLNDEMLFTVPQIIPDYRTKPPKARRPSIKGLWHAFEDKIHPKVLISKSALKVNSNHIASGEHGASLTKNSGGKPPCVPRNKPSHRRVASTSSAGSSRHRLASSESESSFNDIYPSDQEVRPENRDRSDDGSSWDSQDDANHRDYDAWEVLKDEYASDFGFDFTSPSGGASFDDDQIASSFQILGTSVDDEAAQPHVMSPPLLDALQMFLPDSQQGQNFWLRFSLIRDGASLETLKRYVRACEHTIIAIETPKGEVFGCYTSSPWRTDRGFYGSTPAFVWKMRHSRQTKCASLFDQAHLESEIDVFIASGYQDKIQVCRHDCLAVGGDENMPNVESFDDIHDALEAADHCGFAIYLDDDLLRGTTSHCSTFYNPALCGTGSHSEVFEVAGLEVWSLTPEFDVKSAEKLEMTKFFIEESVRSMSSPPTPSGRRSRQFSSNDLEQVSFYRRVGHDPDSESRRDRWQYLNTMNGIGSVPRGMGGSPRWA